MSRSEQIAVAARTATTPGQPGDPRAVRLVYPDGAPTVLRVSREEWWAALAPEVRS